MKTEVSDLSPTRKEVRIEIPADVVRAEYERVAASLTHNVSVPGFRKGHVPPALVRQRYQKEIRREVIGNLIPQALQEAVNEHKLDVIGNPEVKFDEPEGRDDFTSQPLTVTAGFEVMPEIELHQYKGLQVTRQTRPVTEADVDGFVAKLAESSTYLAPVEDRGAMVGDVVTIDVAGLYLDHPSTEKIELSDVEVVLGAEGVMEEFTTNLLGAEPEDVRTFNVKYPPDFRSRDLAGKEVQYTATLISVNAKEVPVIDDEWAQSLGEDIDSVAALRQRINERLTERAKIEADRAMNLQLMDTLAKNHPFEIPASFIEAQKKELVEDFERNVIKHQPPKQRNSLKQNFGEVAPVFRTLAEDHVRKWLLIRKIADVEGLGVSAEEVKSAIKDAAADEEVSEEEFRRSLTKDGGESSIASSLRHRKVIDFLMSAAQIREEEWREPEADSEEPEHSPAGQANEDAPIDAASENAGPQPEFEKKGAQE